MYIVNSRTDRRPSPGMRGVLFGMTGEHNGLNSQKVIPFPNNDHILQVAQRYLEQPEATTLRDDTRLHVLRNALRYAKSDLKIQIMSFLCSLSREDVYWDIYWLMKSDQEEDNVRHQAAVELSNMAERLSDTKEILNVLSADVQSEDPDVRILTTIALGWRANYSGVLALLERVYDTNETVQNLAINSLATIQDERIVPFLEERLLTAPHLQKKAILANLWRFSQRKDAITAIYSQYIQNNDEDLRFDAFVYLEKILDAYEMLPFCLELIFDPAIQIRRLALKRFVLYGSSQDYQSLSEKAIQGLLNDSDMEIKNCALKIRKKRI